MKTAHHVRRAVLLLNVGTPQAPTPEAVRVYLKEFLSDPKVLDINPLARWLLLHAIILPTRSKKSAALYQNVWTKEGSPLLLHSIAQRDELQKRLPDDVVLLAMRYGRPSIADAMQVLQREGVTQVVVVPLYPQYSTAATQSAVDEALKQLNALATPPAAQVVEPFYADEAFIGAQAALVADALKGFDAQHVLFSYHGLPVHQVRATCDASHGCNGGLGPTDCCSAITDKNRSCYRAQCLHTSSVLAHRLQLHSYSTSFQSRLGRTEWLRPYTDTHLPELVARGVKRLLVACPSFVADCLETLEEVGIRAREQFKSQGGEELKLVSCVNAHPQFVDGLAALAQRHGATP